MSIPLVRPVLRAVANGRGGNRLRITLVATPEPVPLAATPEPASSAWFPLNRWPQEMAVFMRTHQQIWVRHAPADATPGIWHPMPITKMALLTVPSDLLGSVSGAWAASIGDDWDFLADDIGRSLGAKQHETALGDYQPQSTVPDDRHFDKQGAIVSSPLRAGDTTKIKGVIPIEHANAAEEMRQGRASRIASKLAGGARIDGDDADERVRRDKQIVPPPIQPDDECYDKERQKAHFDAYLTAVTETTQARTRTRQQHAHMQAVLRGRPAPLVAEKRTNTRAGHIYGTWLQRSTKTPRRPGGKTAVAPTPAVLDTMPGERARTVYYAFQGDPLLSRLFCLSIDIEVGLEGLGSDLEWLSDESEPRMLHLSAEAPPGQPGARDAPDTLPLVITAARLTKQAFWPFSIFDGGLPPPPEPAEAGLANAINLAAYVEQQDGVWRFGGTVPGISATRYELSSLDVRRALAASTEGVDRGERHATGGLMLLDRGRAFQVARDLALTEMHAAKLPPTNERLQTVPLSAVQERQVVLLHAEELTIGRRVDVAAVAADTSIGQVAWRSLMQRFVEFDFSDHRLDRVLRIVLPNDRADDRYLEESSFQVVARLVPHLGSADPGVRSCDVLTEEAIYVWDGTPAAVLTNPGTMAAEAVPLPFSRKYSLPTVGRDRSAPPPPLRYAAPYVLGMRSVFLGGGGPTLAEAARARASLVDRMVPPAMGDAAALKAAPHRFLRHEGIAAPTLLFPDHIAKQRNPHMGYETLDQAIVRSHTTPLTGHDLATTSDESVEPATPASARAIPRTTMRVLVAPEAAHDTVVRHGVLDGANSMIVRRGGLLDVEFLPRLPMLPGSRQREGFPAVCTVRLPALGEQAIYGRVDANNTDDPGIPVFRPLKKSSKRPLLTGYFPDPAAHAFCIRARYRGGDRYLSGHLVAKLYDAQSAYPNALPLVVSVVRIAGLRTLQPVSISELAAPPVVARLDRAGSLQAKTGPRVTHLEVRLMEGEDFDLEIACLPREDMLAQCFAVADTLATRSGTAAVSARQLLETMAEGWPIEEIAAVTSFRVCHAIPCPTVLPLWGTAEQPGSLAVERTANGAVKLAGAIRLDLEQVDGFRIVATTPAATGRPIDDRSRTRSLAARRGGRWPMFTRPDGERSTISVCSVVGFDLDPAGRLEPAQATVTLLEVGNLPVHGSIGPLDPPPTAGQPALFRPSGGRYTEIDLGFLHQAALDNVTLKQCIAMPPGATGDDTRRRQIKAAQPAALVSSIAHTMTLRLIVQSRSASAMETAPFYVDGRERALHRRTPLRPHEQSVVSVVAQVAVSATRRPTACAPRRPEPSFHMCRMVTAHSGGTRHTVERMAKVRLWFARGLFSSGAGERVGIVLWPPQYFDGRDGDFERDLMTVDGREMTLSSFVDADLGPAGSFVSRWGGDPIREDASKQSGFFIPPGAFAEFGECCCAAGPCCCPAASPHRPAKVGRALMSISRNESDSDLPSDDVDTLAVSLLTYEPCFDLDRQEWFVDVDLRPGQAAEPFVRLGLVAYQPDAPEASRVSRPVTVTSSLLARRHVSFQLTDWRLEVKMTGFGSLGIKDLNVEAALPGDPAAAAAYETLKLPAAKLFLFHEQRLDNVVLRTPLLAGDGGEIALLARVDRKQLEWSYAVDLPLERVSRLGPGVLVGYVEEVDRRMPATYGAEPVTLKQMFIEEFVDSGPRFSARVPFRSV